MTHQDWTEQLRDRMADYEAAAPEGLWADIESSLPQQKAKTKALWPRWMSAAAIIAIAAGIGWWLWPANGNRKPEVAATIHQQMKKPQQPLQPDAEPERQTAQGAGAIVPKPLAVTFSEDAKLSEGAMLSEDTTAASVSIPTGQKSEEQARPSKKEEQPLRQQPLPSDFFPLTSHPTSPSHRHRNKISVGIHANNGLLAYNHSNGVQMSAEAAKRYNYSGYSGNQPTRSQGQQDIIWLEGYEERQHHDHPFSCGLTVSYPLTSRWSLQTGLVYTRLHSEFLNIVKQTRINSEQTLYYLGVPLNVQYQLKSGRQWKVYVTGGAQIDWNVRADSETEGVQTQIKKDRAQWSLGAAIGVEYDIIPLLGIYAEPGLRHYFDNGTKVSNYFKDDPTSWSLQFGIRFNLP